MNRHTADSPHTYNNIIYEAGNIAREFLGLQREEIRFSVMRDEYIGAWIGLTSALCGRARNEPHESRCVTGI